MVICDECKSLTEKSFDCNIILEKEGNETVKNGKTVKMTPRKVVTIPLALCDECITRVCSGLGKMKVAGTLGNCGQENKEQA